MKRLLTCVNPSFKRPLTIRFVYLCCVRVREAVCVRVCVFFVVFECVCGCVLARIICAQFSFTLCASYLPPTNKKRVYYFVRIRSIVNSSEATETQISGGRQIAALLDVQHTFSFHNYFHQYY